MSLAANTPSAAADKALGRAFYSTAWRWHFYAGLYVAPFLIMLAITGLIMLWSSVLVGRDGEKLYSVTPAEQTIAVSAQANGKRRPAGASRLVAPITPEKMSIWKSGAIVMVAVSLLFPLTGIVLVTVLALDLLVVRHIKPLKRALS